MPMRKDRPEMCVLLRALAVLPIWVPGFSGNGRRGLNPSRPICRDRESSMYFRDLPKLYVPCPIWDLKARTRMGIAKAGAGLFLAPCFPIIGPNCAASCRIGRAV